MFQRQKAPLADVGEEKLKNAAWPPPVSSVLTSGQTRRPPPEQKLTRLRYRYERDKRGSVLNTRTPSAALTGKKGAAPVCGLNLKSEYLNIQTIYSMCGADKDALCVCVHTHRHGDTPVH